MKRLLLELIVGIALCLFTELAQKDKFDHLIACESSHNMATQQTRFSKKEKALNLSKKDSSNNSLKLKSFTKQLLIMGKKEGAMECTNENMPCPRTEKEWEEYEKMKRESVKSFIDENGNIIYEITNYS